MGRITIGLMVLLGGVLLAEVSSAQSSIETYCSGISGEKIKSVGCVLGFLSKKVLGSDFSDRTAVCSKRPNVNRCLKRKSRQTVKEIANVRQGTGVALNQLRERTYLRSGRLTQHETARIAWCDPGDVLIYSYCQGHVDRHWSHLNGEVERRFNGQVQQGHECHNHSKYKYRYNARAVCVSAFKKPTLNLVVYKK